MPNDSYKDPKEGKTYISPSLPAFGDSERKVRIASKVVESPDAYAFAKIENEVVLRHTEGAKTYIKATPLHTHSDPITLKRDAVS